MGNNGSADNQKSGVFKKLFGNKEIRILMIGLDCAGKTTILYNLKMGKVVRTKPTIGEWFYLKITCLLMLENNISDRN